MTHLHRLARHRRALLASAALTVLGATLVLGSARAQAQTQAPYPSKPITLIVGAAPGGTTDIAARMLAEPLGRALGQTVVVDNRSGASGALAAVAVKRADPDGYTLLMQYSGYHVITPHIQKSPQWDLKDLRPVANVLSAPQLIVAREGVAAKTTAELIDYAKKHPGELSYASSGNGSLQHVTGAMLEQQAGIRMVHIPYKGTGPALQDLLGGQVDVTFGTPPPFMPFIASGKLRALAVTGTQRLASLPNVPTAAQAGLPDLDAGSWFAVYAPAKTPQAVVDKLTAEIAKLMATPAFKQKASELGATADYMNPQQLEAHGAAEYQRWGKVITAAKIQAD